TGVGRACNALAGETALLGGWPDDSVRLRVALRRPVPPGPPAAAVAILESPPPRAADDPLAPAHIDHLRVGVEQDSGEAAVARPALDSLRGDRQRELRLRRRRAHETEQGLDRASDL